jgi:hypothetical protein
MTEAGSAITSAAAFPFCGRPKMIYLDNGPIAKSRVFQNVMDRLDIVWQTISPPARMADG